MEINLPYTFLKRMENILKDEYESFLRCYNEKPLKGLRVNTIKCSVEKLKLLLDTELRPSSFSDVGFYIESDEKLGNNPLHHCGAFYIQEPSASGAVKALKIEPDDKVLDLCAAPGGKSTQIAALLGEKGFLWSNEIIKSRANILLSNIERMGIKNCVVSSLSPEKLCPELGGYFDAGDSLREVQRNLGKLTVALADSLNKQNKSGITLENKAGDALFNLPETRVFTKSTTAGMTMSFMEGYASNVTGKDYLIKINGDGTYSLNEKDGNNLTEIFQGNTADLNGTITIPGLGFQLEVDGVPSAGDEFLIQPTANVSYNLSMKINRPEDFALASVIRASENSQNLGNATIAINGVTNTDAASAFSMTPSRSITSASFDAGAPVKVVINATGDYEVYDTNDNLIGTTIASTKGGNILANMLSDVTDPDSRVYADPSMTPGYDFSITGTVRNGDSFEIELNTNGFADNSNGIMMQNLEQAQLVQGRINQTVSASYSDMVSNLGSTIAVSNVNLEAATAKRDQTLTITEESSGVDLNEEASNLVRYQQCYQASARIIAASQTVFDSLMSALG